MVKSMEIDGNVRQLQAALFPVYTKSKAGSYLSNFLQQTLRTNQVEINTDSRTNKAVAKLKEPRDLYALQKEFCPQQAPRWPAECQVVEDHIRHIDYAPSFPEQYYEVTGSEVQPKPVGEEYGEVIFQYFPVSAVNYFSRSCVGGNQVVINGIPLLKNNDQFLRFESRFESGNLAKAVRVTDTYYELYLRTDMYTNRHMQWYYFRVENMKKHLWYRFSIVNLTKPDSLYSCGMKPLMYSTREAAEKSIGWRRCGDNITYFRNDSLSDDDDDQPTSYTLSFNVAFPHDDDTVYMAHSYPYTYTHLQDYLMQLHNDPLKSTFCKLRLLCRSLAGNNVYYLTITAPSTSEEPKKKKAIVVTARVHPGETPSSWMMKGFIDYLTSDSYQARELREKFIFKLVPMLNPDGVIVGNNRCSLTGRDLNRQYRTVMRETYPPVWHTKVMIRRLMEECGILMYCDLHAHSRKHNIFMYGCETKITSDRHLQEQVFPLMLHKNAADKFSFESCKFKIQKSKEGTGRIVVWMMGILNSYTMEASFGGSLLGSRSNTHFSTADFESMGKYFCETLIDFCDEDPAKERLRTKIINRLAKEGSSAEEPTNIDLSDYTSDEGDTSSCTDDEDNVQQIMNNFGQQQDSNIILEESQSTRLSKKNLRENRKTMKNMGFPEKNPRRPLKVNQATLKLTPGAAESSEMPSCDISDDRTLEDIAALLSRKQKLDWVKRAQGRKDNLTSAAKGGKGGERTFMTAMPPELVVTSAQVYDNQTFFESSGRYTRKETRDDMPHISRSAVGFRRYDDKPEFRRHRSHSVSVETAEENQTGYRIHPCCSKYYVSSRPGFYREKVPHQAVDDLSYDLQWKMNIHSASILNPMRQRLWFGVQAPVEPEGTSAQYVENSKIMEQNNALTKRNITEENKDVVIWGYTNKPICLENQHAAVDRSTSGSKKIKNTVHSVTKGTGKAETSDSVKHKRKQRLKKQKALKTEKEIQIIEECIKSSSHDANKKSISGRSGIVHTLKKQHASCSAERSEEEKKIKSPKKCTEKFHSQSTSRSPCRKKPQVSSITDTDSDDGNKSEDPTSTHRKNRKRKITQKKPKKIAATLSQAKKPLKKNIKKKTGT